MHVVGVVESLWRYPVKSMGGEQLESAFAGSYGIEGDRVYAIHDAAAPADFPYLTARQREQMLLYQPRFCEATGSACSSSTSSIVRDSWNDSENDSADSSADSEADTARMSVEVLTPGAKRFSIDDPALLVELGAGLREGHTLKLIRSDRGMTDCSPISLFSLETARQLGDELGIPIDKRRFRANIYVTLSGGRGFGEDAWIGHSLGVGAEVVLSVLDRDPRCKIITLDPDTAEANPGVIRQVAQAHDRRAGIYAAVLVEGTIRTGDAVVLLS